MQSGELDGIVTWLQAGQPRNSGSVLNWSDFSFIQNIQISSLDYLRILTITK